MMQKFNRTTYVLSTFVAYGIYSVFGKHAKAQRWLFDRLTALGGIYVKFLQLITLNDTNPDKSAASLSDLLSVYDHVAYEEVDVKQLVSDELGAKSTSIVLDDEPFAAGSFAQVYGGLLNGQRIIVKVLRPSVQRFLRFDLGLLSVAVRMVSFAMVQDMLDLVTIFSDFRRMTLGEVDYLNEVNNAKLIAAQLDGHPVIYIPYTYEEYSTKHIVVQERIDGLALTQLFSSDIENKLEYVEKNLGTNLNFVMEELAVELLAGSLVSNGSHADPHPGNIYLLPNNKIALIDFGIRGAVQKHQAELLQLVAEYVRLYKGEFSPERFTKAMISYYVPELTSSIQTLGEYYGNQELVMDTMGAIGLSVSDTLLAQSGDPMVSAMMEQYRMTNLFMQVINKNNRFGFRINFETPAFVRSTQIFMQVTRRLDIDMQLLRRAWQRVIDDNSHLLLSAQSAACDNESIDRSFHELSTWLDRLCYSDPGLYNRVMRTWGGVI